MFVLIAETWLQFDTYASALSATVAASSVDVYSDTQNQRRKSKDKVVLSAHREGYGRAEV
jgi:hypothetical protein